MPATDLAQYPQFAIKSASDAAFTSPVTIAEIDSFTLTDQNQTQTVTSFDTGITAIADKLLMQREIGLTFTANLKPSDAGYQAIMAARKAGTYTYVEVTWADTNASPTTESLQLGGYWSQVDVQGQMPIAKLNNVTFAPDTIISDTRGG